MKTAFTDGKKPVTQGQAVVCALVNQFATPGLGSWMGGRKLAGIGQLLLALLGFALVCAWMAGSLMSQLAEAGMDPVGPAFLQTNPGRLGKAGAVSFGVSWVWSMITSVQLLLKASSAPPPGPPTPPPVPPPLQ